MHKGVILLTKAIDREIAISNIHDFMEGYKDQVWDWYVIGGRWSGSLNLNIELFLEKANEALAIAYPDDKMLKEGLYSSMIIEENKAIFEKIWKELGETSTNPFNRNQYNDIGDTDDIQPLSDCIDIIKEWTKDMDEKAEEYWEKMLKEHESEVGENKKSTMSAYYAGMYKDCRYDNFSFESNVYDIENQTNNPEKALSEPNGYYAIMVDMHN